MLTNQCLWNLDHSALGHFELSMLYFPQTPLVVSINLLHTVLHAQAACVNSLLFKRKHKPLVVVVSKEYCYSLVSTVSTALISAHVK